MFSLLSLIENFSLSSFRADGEFAVSLGLFSCESFLDSFVMHYNFSPFLTIWKAKVPPKVHLFMKG